MKEIKIIVTIILLILIVQPISSSSTILTYQNITTEGYIQKAITVYTRQNTSDYDWVGVTGAIYLNSYFQFDTSQIPDNANISAVYFNFTNIPNSDYGLLVNVTRFNSSNMSRYGNNANDNKALFENITIGFNGLGNYITKSTAFRGNGSHYIDFGTGGVADLKSQLSNNFFAFGLTGASNDGTANITAINNSRSLNGFPFLVIVFDTCIPPTSGDWVVNDTCVYNNRTISIPGNLTIQDSGVINLSDAFFNFTSTGQWLNMNPGARINLNGKNSSIGKGAM